MATDEVDQILGLVAGQGSFDQGLQFLLEQCVLEEKCAVIHRHGEFLLLGLGIRVMASARGGFGRSRAPACFHGSSVPD